jgi:hypothetical protein
MWGAGVGVDGKLYFCGQVGRQGNGGSLGWWDPNKQESGGLDWKTFAGHATFYMYTTDEGKHLILTSHVTVNNLTGEVPDTAKVFFYDVRQARITSTFEPIPGSPMLGPIVEVRPGVVFGVASGGGYRDENRQDILFGLDVSTQKVLFRRTIPAFFCCFCTGIRGGQEFVRGPDGWVWTYLGPSNHPEYPTLIRIHPESGDISVVGRVERRGPMAFVGNDLYRGCEHKMGHLKLRRLEAVTTRKVSSAQSPRHPDPPRTHHSFFLKPEHRTLKPETSSGAHGRRTRIERLVDLNSYFHHDSRKAFSNR